MTPPKKPKPGDMVDDVDLWREMQDRYGDYSDGCMGAEAIKKRLQSLDSGDHLRANCARRSRTLPNSVRPRP